MGPSIEQYSSVDEALQGVLGKLRLTRRVQVLPTAEAYGRISAKDLTSPTAVPPFATSHMDGFALRAEDLEVAREDNPVALSLKGEARLGAEANLKVSHREAVRVSTGSRIPAGADTVIPIEQTKRKGTRVVVNFRPEPGRYVYAMGKDVRRGELILAQGQVIRAQKVGLLLGLGISRVKVWEKPKVSVVATGSELTDAAKPKPGMVRNSHSPVFLRLVEAVGGVPVNLGIAEDDLRTVTGIIRRALTKSDFVLTLGGTSAGERDVVGDAIKALRPAVVFHGIRMDRGRVTGVAVVNGKPILMMPGPIQGAMNAFILFGVPIINRLSGRRDGGLEVPCLMAEAWEARRSFPNFRKVVYVKLQRGEETLAEPLAGETESIKVLTDADGYIVVPESVKRIEKGSRVKVQLLPGFSFA